MHLSIEIGTNLQQTVYLANASYLILGWRDTRVKHNVMRCLRYFIPLVRDGWKLIQHLQQKPEQYLTKHI